MIGLSVPVLQSFQFQNDIQASSDLGASAVRTASNFARSGKTDSEWGVRFQVGTIYVFQGNNFNTRDTSYDYEYDISTSVSVSGLSEIIFSRFTGLPQSTGTVTFSNSSDTRQITINSRGGLTFTN